MKIKNIKWAYSLLVFAIVFTETVAFSAAGDRYIRNQNLDRDIDIIVNDGGVDTTVLKIQGSTSRVGINTTPASPLTILQSENNSNDDGIILDAAGAGSFRLYLDGTNLKMSKSGNEALIINSSANVGIGSGTIDTHLHVNGSGTQAIKIDSTDGTSQLQFEGVQTGSNGTFSEFSFTNNGDSVASILVQREDNDDAAEIAFSTQPTGGVVTERFKIKSDGILEVLGNQTTDAAIGTLSFYNNASSVDLGQIIVRREGANNSGEIGITTNNAGTITEKVTIAPNGDVTFTGDISANNFVFEEFNTSLTSSGDFTGGTIYGARVGSRVTLTVTGAAWTDDNSVLSASGVVPANFQPTKEILNVSGVENSRAVLMRISPSGQLILDIRTSSDLDVAAGATTDGTDVDTRDFSISYIVY